MSFMMNDFNSIKVQLRHRLFYADSDFVETFQFHKGTIKTISIFIKSTTKPKFQFHKGTIKTATANYLPINCQYFNSIKVQLRLMSLFVNLFVPLFQFHKGTIKTSIAFRLLSLIAYFNSIKVQLRHACICSC